MLVFIEFFHQNRFINELLERKKGLNPVVSEFLTFLGLEELTFLIIHCIEMFLVVPIDKIGHPQK